MTLLKLAASAIVDRQGNPTRAFLARFNDLVEAVNSALGIATAAAPQSRQVVGAGGLHSVAPELTSDVGIVFYKVMAVVASLPTSGNATGDWAYAENGRKPGEAGGAGTGVPVFWSAGAWIAVTSGVAVTA